MGPDRIVIVGCGPGAPEHVTGAARRAAEEADALVGHRRLLELFPEAPGRRIPIAGAVEPALEAIAGCRGTVAVLVSGDPGLHSLARPVLQRFPGRCRVVPGVSSIQAAFARLGLPWEDARVVSAHGKVPEVTPEALTGERAVAVLGGNRRTQGWVRALALALAATHRGWALTDLTLPGERVEPVDPAVLPLGRTVFVFVRKDGRGESR